MTVLNVVNDCGILWLVLLGLAIFAIGSFLVMVIGDTSCSEWPIFTGIGGILVGLIIAVCGLCIPNGELKYEVTLDDNVKMVEFYEQYEVVEQRGDIWVIKEKE